MHRAMFLIATLGAVACADDAQAPAVPDGGAVPDATTELGPCPADTLCLTVTEVVPGEPIGPGHLVVVWRQLLDVSGIDEVPKVAYDGAFTPGAARYEIPLAGLVPPDDNQLMCQWEPDGCHREESPQAVGFGMVMVVTDDNADGFLETDELSPYGAKGAAFAYVAWSEHARPAGHSDLVNFDGTPSYLGRIFPNGILAGNAGYVAIGPDANFESTLEATRSDHPVELAMCPTTKQCQITIPRLAGTTYP